MPKTNSHTLELADVDDIVMLAREADREELCEALIDTAEFGKHKLDWLMDALMVMFIRRGVLPEPPEGSDAARFLRGPRGVH